MPPPRTFLRISKGNSGLLQFKRPPSASPGRFIQAIWEEEAQPTVGEQTHPRGVRSFREGLTELDSAAVVFQHCQLPGLLFRPGLNHPPMTAQIIPGAYLNDILQQPSALRACVDGLRSDTAEFPALGPPVGEGAKRFVLTGMGSSFHSLYPLHRELLRRGARSVHMETAELLDCLDGVSGPEVCLIAVSQSGESAEVVSLMEHAGRFGQSVGVTNDPVSTLAKSADTLLQLRAGKEATVSCKTYLNTLAALRWLEGTLMGEDPAAVLAELEPLPEAVKAYLEQWESHAGEALELLSGVETVYVVGRGRSLATAGTGGLILKESTRRPCEGMSAAAFRHGPLELVGPSKCVLVIDADGEAGALNRKLAADIVSLGGAAELISANRGADFLSIPRASATVRPVLEMLPVQLVSLALAAHGGHEAGRFERASKITTAS